MKIAAIQTAPIFLDPARTTDKALALMKEVAREGAKLCAFSEVFLPGYPFWLRRQVSSMEESLRKECLARYLTAAVDPDGPEISAIVEQAKSLGLFTYLGFVERAPSLGTVFCSLAAIHPEEGIVSIHRKTKPTLFERLIWADGDGNGLQVHRWKGFRVGGLNCFENWQPLPRQTLYAQGEQLHVAVWPGHTNHHECSKFVAQEGRIYVVSVAGVMRERDIPESFPLKGSTLDKELPIFSGGSTIFDPNGEIVAGPLGSDEGILYADVDVNRVMEERLTLDPAGHYGRPDVFRLEVDRERRQHVRMVDHRRHQWESADGAS